MLGSPIVFSSLLHASEISRGRVKWVCHLLATRPPFPQVCMRASLSLAGCEVEPRCIKRVRVVKCVAAAQSAG